MPECTVHLTEAVVYLSLAPKSNALYVAYGRARKDALTMLAEPVPLVIRNAPTKLMRELDYGKGYQYAHDTAEKLTDMQCLPDSLSGREYYTPTQEGAEAKFSARLQDIKAWKRARLREAHPPRGKGSAPQGGAQRDTGVQAGQTKGDTQADVPETGKKEEE